MTEPREVAENIFIIKQEGSLLGLRPPLNIYALAGEDGLIFDAGYGTGKALRHARDSIRAIEKLYRSRGMACSFTRILPSHTHPDHFSGLSGMRSVLGLKVLLTMKMSERIRSYEHFMKSNEMPERDMDVFSHPQSRLRILISRKIFNYYIRMKFGLTFITGPDELIEEESTIEVNGEEWLIMAGPGHWDDHVMLYSRGRGLLLAGDNVLRSINTWLGTPWSSLADYIKTLQRIKALPGIRKIMSAHGSSMENPLDRINEIIRYRNARTSEIAGIIENAGTEGISFHDIVAAVYPRESSMRYAIIEGWIIVTIQHLENEGLIRREKVNNGMRFIYKS